MSFQEWAIGLLNLSLAGIVGFALTKISDMLREQKELALEIERVRSDVRVLNAAREDTRDHGGKIADMERDLAVFREIITRMDATLQTMARGMNALLAQKRAEAA